MPAAYCLLVPLLFAFPEGDRKPGELAAPPDEVRRVVAAIVRAAEENAARGAGRLRGGDLADYYVRRAAAAADREGVTPAAFLLALGVGLDHTDVLRGNPVTRG